jgi:hypothetical protein
LVVETELDPLETIEEINNTDIISVGFQKTYLILPLATVSLSPVIVRVFPMWSLSPNEVPEYVKNN